MDMPSYDDAYERAVDKPAFSNDFEAECWKERWCHRCVNDAASDCPLILVALMDRTPAQWQAWKPAELGYQYKCTLFDAGGTG
jgi:hypothetical protein